MAAIAPETWSEARRACTRQISGHPYRTPAQVLTQLAASPEVDLEQDVYGEGGALANLERTVADLLGKEAGVFVMKGMIAQLCALRVWTDRSGARTVALHPKSHIDIDENGAFERLHPLDGVRLGRERPFGAADLEGVRERLGAVVVELPLRRAGYRLLPWDDLVAIRDWCAERSVPLHFDGARLWESGPFYERSYAEIAALADSVYVSFYKGLGGLAGCVLCGSADFVEEVRVWQGRHGGSLFTAYPYALAAQGGLREHLPRMPEYVARARGLAARLAQVPGLRVEPQPPHTNAFQVYVPVTQGALRQAALEVAERERIWLFHAVYETPWSDVTMVEITVGAATADFDDDAVAELFAGLAERAAALDIDLK